MPRSCFTNVMCVTVCAYFTFGAIAQSEAQVQTLSSSSSQQSSRSTTGGTGSSIGSSTSGNQLSGNSQSGLSTMGNMQSLNPQNGFIGRSDAAQETFIGRNNTQNAGTNNGGQNRNFNRATTSGFQSGQNQFNAGQSAAPVPAFRPQMRVAFTAAPLPLSNVQASMGQSFDRIKERNEHLSGVQFELNADHSVTLRGQVESAGARKLVEFLAMLEPGVRKVTNELTVVEK
ncbi:MAG: BON domain-containing protein [Planctomycetota bacterium]